MAAPGAPTFLAACRRLACVTGLSAAAVLLGAGVASADEENGSTLLGSVTSPVETVVTDEVAPALEETTQALAEVTEPVLAPVAPVSDAVAPTLEPATDVVVEVSGTAVRPVVELTEPLVELTEPVVDVAEPVTSTVTPALEPVTAPVIRTVEQVVETTEPVTSQVTGPLSPVTEPVEAILEPVDDAIEDVELVDDVVDAAPVVDRPAAKQEPAGEKPSVPVVESSSTQERAASTDAPAPQHRIPEASSPAPRGRGYAAPVPTVLAPVPLVLLQQASDNSAQNLDSPVAPAAADASPRAGATAWRTMPAPSDAPAQAGSTSSAGGTSGARPGVDGLTDDLFDLPHAHGAAVPDAAGESAPRDPYRDIPTSPA